MFINEFLHVYVTVYLLSRDEIASNIPYICDYKSRNIGQFLKREVGGSTYTRVKEKCQV